MIDKEDALQAAAEFLVEFMSGVDDPEDTIFLTITHKEASLISHALMMSSAGIIGSVTSDSCRILMEKMMGAIVEQKLPS